MNQQWNLLRSYPDRSRCTLCLCGSFCKSCQAVSGAVDRIRKCGVLYGLSTSGREEQARHDIWSSTGTACNPIQRMCIAPTTNLAVPKVQGCVEKGVWPIKIRCSSRLVPFWQQALGTVWKVLGSLLGCKVRLMGQKMGRFPAVHCKIDLEFQGWSRTAQIQRNEVVSCGQIQIQKIRARRQKSRL